MQKLHTSTKLLILGLVLVFTLAGYYFRGTAPDRTGADLSRLKMINDTNLILAMKTACEASYGVIDGALETKCGDLIDRVECRGYLVLHTSSGKFSAVEYPKAECKEGK